MNLSERYRPTCLDDVVGQDKAIKVLRRLAPGGRAFYLSGPSGSGKTTIARILAKGIASPWFGVVEVVARDQTVATLKDIAKRWMFAGGHALIINEIHGLSRPCMELMLDLMENLQDHVTLCFTTTNKGRDLFEDKVDSGPFASRCVNIKLVNRGLVTDGEDSDGNKLPGAFTLRAFEIAQKENLNGRPIADYIRLLENCKGNLRTALQKIECGAMLED